MHETAQLRSPGVLSRSRWQHPAKPPASNTSSPVSGSPALLGHGSVTPRFRLFVRRMQILFLRVKLRWKIQWGRPDQLKLLLKLTRIWQRALTNLQFKVIRPQMPSPA